MSDSTGAHPDEAPELLGAACEQARAVLRSEAAALVLLSESPLPAMERALGLLASATLAGAFIATTGLGKSAFAAQRLAASLSAIGAPALFIHPSDAMHGDSGALAFCHALVAISRSGETPEVVSFAMHSLPTPVIALCEGGALSALASAWLRLPPLGEALPELPLPSVSAALEGALCDALALGLAALLPASARFYRTVHPGGVLGREMRH